MTDQSEVQLQELEALESIFVGEITIHSKAYPEISLSVTLQSHAMCEPPVPGSPNYFTATISVELPRDYPEVVPKMHLFGLEERFGDARAKRILEDLKNVANNNLGMPMIFTIVTALEEHMATLYAELDAMKDQLEAQKREEEEARTKKKIEGTPVTPENFREWKLKFDAEMSILHEREQKEREAALAGKLTGRQLFLKDATLSLSDVALMQAAGNVEIDESLFEEELEGLDAENSDENDA